MIGFKKNEPDRSEIIENNKAVSSLFFEECYEDSHGHLFVPVDRSEDYIKRCVEFNLRIDFLEGVKIHENEITYSKYDVFKPFLFDRSWKLQVQNCAQKVQEFISSKLSKVCTHIFFISLSKPASYPCPCCNYLTRSQKDFGTFEICSVCGWEDDDVQVKKPDSSAGANKVSLNQARENYKKFGASTQERSERVRPPNEDDIPK